MAKLNRRQAAFAYEYVKDLNATQAAIRAGYSPRSAAAQGSINVNTPKIAEAINKIFLANCLEAEEALSLLSDIAKADIGNYLIIDPYGYIRVDLAQAFKDGNTKVIKKIKQREFVNARGRLVSELEIELYDSQGALNTILQLYARLQKTMETEESLRAKVIDGLRNGSITEEDVRANVPDLATELFSKASIG